YNRLRAIVCAAANRLHHAIDAELVSIGVKRFGHTVGVENETIVAVERYREIDSKPIEHASAVNSYHHAGDFTGVTVCDCRLYHNGASCPARARVTPSF